MRDTTLLQLALALTPPWTVSRSDFDPKVRIPTQGGHRFRFDRGHPTDLMAATIPI